MLKYEQIALQINAYIAEGNYQAGDKLPSVETLKTQYEVSKSTIIKALEALEKKGRIYQARGSGIYVRNPKRDGYLNLFSSSGFSDEIVGHSVTNDVIRVEEVIAPEEVRQKLKLDKDTEVYVLERIVHIDGKVLCYEQSYFNKDIVLYLDTSIAEGSIFRYLEQRIKVKIGFSDIYFTVDKLNSEEAPLLNLSTGEPCLRYEQVFYTTTGVPFDCSQLIYHYENAHFYIPSQK
ncbi:GntR family transcriptional regulator [Staphylococcus gallinarum]|uniref:GntR family transcriptional regulator n=1 Tax=Staphylococcus gallinarum TaxID=1293 RepID=UPI000D1DB207|nr:GntR family transcriptional regulator [Staphylococcus gallinarum]MCD8785112.1 GntR family transcriptional regulator [Staphylococcus gallinarum]MCD8845310.1 GntR family transcriptional regulator [Staphylococcus gallinarum]MCD8857821.1 GntR family transcriptional regulator [Staphylococcus gallinarum]PTL17859.1 GntR family transcriptional regulator [Staphylococcus gallinarum]RIO79014.1 GntR family transcriptional regulator [Staphylococcus gallinarum]